MASRFSRRTLRRLKRSLMPFAALLLLLLVVLLASRFAPRPDDEHLIRVPTAASSE